MTENVHIAQGHLDQERQVLQSTNISNYNIFKKTDSEIKKEIQDLKMKSDKNQPFEDILQQEIQQDTLLLSEKNHNKKKMMWHM